MKNNPKWLFAPFFLNVILLIFLVTPGAILAQPVYDKDVSLFIRQVGSGWIDDKLAYEFFLDTDQLNNLEFEKVTNLSINTDHGVIKFPIEILKNDVPRYFIGALSVDNNINKVIITKAVADIDNVTYDITNNIIPLETLPFKIEKEELESGMCPNTRLDLTVKEGDFVRVNEDTGEALIKIDGKEIGFMYNDSLSYFFHNAASNGKKIKFVTTVIQATSLGAKNNECVPVDQITDLIALN
jgi:hypothetical protein